MYFFSLNLELKCETSGNNYFEFLQRIMNLLNGFLRSLVLLPVILLYLFLLPTSNNSMFINTIHTKKCIPHHVNKELRCYPNEEINDSVRINQSCCICILAFIATRYF